MNLKEKMISSLEQADLSPEHKEYIKSVVAYIDNALTSRMQGDNISIGTYVNEMLEIAKQIKQGKTGNKSIDEMGEVRPFVDNYIATISDAGGMYKYVLEVYEQEISSGEITTRQIGQVTKNASTTTKMEAEKEESKRDDIKKGDNIKKGEEVGDDS